MACTFLTHTWFVIAHGEGETLEKRVDSRRVPACETEGGTYLPVFVCLGCPTEPGGKLALCFHTGSSLAVARSHQCQAPVCICD